MDAILSIKPQFVKEIASGNKKYEFRKKIFKHSVETIYIYASYPECAIVGKFTLGDILEGKPADLWEKTKEYAGCSKDYFDNYFLKHKKAYALTITDLYMYRLPCSLQKIFGIKIAPQSFCYVHRNS